MSEPLYKHDRGPGCPETEVIELLAAGGDVEAPVREHAATCPACKAVLEQIRADSDAVDVYIEALTPSKTLATRESRYKAPEAADVSPDIVPGYKVTELLGQGGQGSVYKAVQLGTKRDVAIKLLRAGRFSTSRQRLRMEREAEIVAGLKHPNIVTIHESRYLDATRYAMVMEYIDGVSLDAWRPSGKTAKEKREKVLRVFAQVCAGVNHAHRNGVAHRDMKPSNVLVDKEGVPHILDFGIAKALGTDGPALTATGESAFTLHYASPEQVSIGDEQIDFRTDVYSLGVILYVLLCGTYPYPLEGSIFDAVRSIRDVEPTRPREVDRTIDVDLETIVLKALQKDRNRRYDSALELGRDIERYLRHEAIDARRDSVLYVLAMRVRKHWLPITVTAGVVAAVLVVWQTRADRRKALEQRAKEERTAEATGIVVRELLPARGASGEWGEVVDRVRGLQTAADLGVLPDDPELHASIMNVAGVLAQELRSEWAAEWSQRESLVVARQNPSPVERDLAMAQSKHDLARALLGNRSRLREARALAEESLELRRTRLGERDKEFAEGMELLGRVELADGNLIAARQIVERASDTLRRMPEVPRVSLARCSDALARVALGEGKYDEAEGYCQSALSTRVWELRDTHPEVIESVRLFGEVNRARGREDDLPEDPAHEAWRTWGANRWFEMAKGLDRSATGFSPTRYADALGELANWKKSYIGMNEREIAETLAAHAWWLVRSGRSDRAAEVFAELVPKIESLGAPNSIAVANCYEQIGLCRNFVGARAREAEEGARQHLLAVEAYEKCLVVVNKNPAYAKDAALVAKLRLDHASSYALAAGRDPAQFARADEVCQEAIDFTRANLGAEFYRLPAALQTHAELLMRRAETRDAALARIEEAVGLRWKIDSTPDARLARMLETKGYILMLMGRGEEAVGLARLRGPFGMGAWRM